MGKFPGFQPALQAVEKKFIGEILAPERGIADTRFGQRAIEVQHADESRPGSRPVRDRENWSAMRDQAVKKMMRILPDALGHDERSLRVEPGENRHALLL